MGRGLNIEQKVTLHNEFHLVLTDSRTGKVKQEGWAHNIVLDEFFTRLINDLVYHSTSSTVYTNYFRYTSVGTGAGTPSPERTTLFANAGRKHNQWESEVDYSYHIDGDYLKGFITHKAIWTELELQNTSLTEVGLGSTDTTTMHTHAMIEDSEGNPISIAKGETDILTVYSTVYVEVSHSYGDNCAMNTLNTEWISSVQEANFIVMLICAPPNKSANVWGFSLGNVAYQIYYGFDARTPAQSDRVILGLIDSITFQANNTDNVTPDTAGKKVSIYGRLPASSGNHPAGIKEIGFRRTTTSTIFRPPLFRLVFPITGVYEGTTIEGDNIGVGDGAEDKFETTWMPIVAESEIIKVDGVVKTRGIDYTIHNTSVPYGENIFLRCGIKTEGSHIQSTELPKLYDELTSTYLGWTTAISGNAFVDEPTLVLDSGAVNYTNKMRYYQYNTGNWSLRAFKFEGSNDLANWTTIVDDEIPNSVGWHEFSFTEVGYRYWKFISLSTWGTIGGIRMASGPEFLQTKPQIVFASPPADTLAIEAEYDVEFVPKDVNHVLDISFTLQFGDGNAV